MGGSGRARRRQVLTSCASPWQHVKCQWLTMLDWLRRLLTKLRLPVPAADSIYEPQAGRGRFAE